MKNSNSNFNHFDPDDFRRTIPRFQGENFANNLKLVDKINEIENKKGVLGHRTGNVPRQIIKYLKENFGASKIHLDFEELSQFGEITDSIEVID
ncbi:unnamed protein product [Rhizophagus irregularis]|nr:unnamed protein product [Rhizophagus irregularis]CAB4444655.1 unnamed protein product [Rhizophagus irregularis]